jgi:amidase
MNEDAGCGMPDAGMGRQKRSRIFPAPGIPHPASFLNTRMQPITARESGAFIEAFSLPPTGDGPLDGLRFAVKDLIDVAGHSTGCGNPTWLATHPPAPVSAVCVEQLLAAGATCVGKTITDEVAFSLLGENHFYGTPLNPAAMDRVPGGSSSGSASAVACGLADFALGTDTGGSVRVPASNCGIWGLRPTHGRVSVAGVMPFSPTLDTVGVLARDIEVLQRSMAVLLGCPERAEAIPTGENAAPRIIHFLTDAFDISDVDVKHALEPAIESIRRLFGERVHSTSLAELCGCAEAADLTTWLNIYRMLQGTEAWSNLSAWVHDAKPEFGPATAAGFKFINSLDRTRVGEAVHRRELYCRQLSTALGQRDILCFPTTPTIAPLKGARVYDRGSDYYQRTLALTAIAGVGRLPQVSMPLGRTPAAPIGLSLAGAQGEDLFVLEVAGQIAEVRRAKSGA